MRIRWIVLAIMVLPSLSQAGEPPGDACPYRRGWYTEMNTVQPVNGQVDLHFNLANFGDLIPVVRTQAMVNTIAPGLHVLDIGFLDRGWRMFTRIDSHAEGDLFLNVNVCNGNTPVLVRLGTSHHGKRAIFVEPAP